jgi:hypothetical protein
VVVHIGGGARTLLPDAPVFTAYQFTFESPGKATVTRTSAGPSLELELAAGEWTLTVTGFTGPEPDRKETAQGTADLTVTVDQTSSVSVELAFYAEGGTGVFNYALQFPNTVSEASLVLRPLASGTASRRLDLLEGSSILGNARVKTGALTLEAGYYFLTLDLYSSSDGAVEKTEALHVYRNTAVNAAYSFTVADFDPIYITTGAGTSLYDALTAIGSAVGTEFTIVLGQDEPAFASFVLSAANYGGKRISLRGGGHTVTLADTGGSLFFFDIGAGALVLRDITLQGRGLEVENSRELVSVCGGELVIKSGTVIKDNNNSSSAGGGVYVGGGTFTMEGGTISGNMVSSSSYYYYASGGGVYVNSGTFTMEGGVISGNTAPRGGGVYVGDGTFTMAGGARIDPANKVYLHQYSGINIYITITGNFTANDDIAVIDLEGTAADWLGKSILQRGTAYTGPIPHTRFRLGNFVSTDSSYTKMPIVGYHIDSDGILVQD